MYSCKVCSKTIHVDRYMCRKCAREQGRLDKPHVFEDIPTAKTLEEVIAQYKYWSKWNDFHITMPATMIKLMEELGEMAHAVHRGNKEGIVDAMADVFITLCKVPIAMNCDMPELVLKVWEQVRQRDYKTYPEGRPK